MMHKNQNKQKDFQYEEKDLLTHSSLLRYI